MSEENNKKVKNEEDSLEEKLREEEALPEEPLKDSIKFEHFESKDWNTEEDGSKGEITPKSIPLEEYQRLENELKETKEMLYRVAADFENYKKRIAKEKEELIKYSNEQILRDLLDTADNLELTLLHSQQAASKNEDVIKGFEITVKGFIETLKRFGVTQLNVENTTFDPNFHEAIGIEESESVPSGHIIRVERKGYMLRDRLLRPALVVVSKGKPAVVETQKKVEEAPEHKCIAEPKIEEDNEEK